MKSKYEEKGSYHWKIYGGRNLYTRKVNKIVSLVDEGEKVLDVGCGDGLVSSLLAEKADVHGVDMDSKAIELAKEKTDKDILFQKADALDLPVEDKSFDVVTLVDVIEHVKDSDELISGCKELLKKEGRILVSTPLKQSKEFHDEHHEREYTEKELTTLLWRHFSGVKVYTINETFFEKLKRIGKSVLKGERVLPRTSLLGIGELR